MLKNLTTTEITALVTLFLLILGIVGSFIKHIRDAKFRKRDHKLQENQLEKINDEKVRQKQAKIKAEIESKINMLVTIKITNIGFCDANDLKIDIQENTDFQIKTNHISKELLRTVDYEYIKLYHIYGEHSKLRLDFTWNDKFQNDNKDYAELILT